MKVYPCDGEGNGTFVIFGLLNSSHAIKVGREKEARGEVQGVAERGVFIEALGRIRRTTK
jgi:hypothetical protein